MSLQRISVSSAYVFFFLINCLLIGTSFSEEPFVIWVQADSLGPGWGLYPIDAKYGDTKPLGRAAFARSSSGRLTWVADFPKDGLYHVWVRRYGGSGNVEVYVDEQPVAGGRGGPGGARYVWRHLGEKRIYSGQRHVDISIENGIFDAVLFTTATGFDPEQETLPGKVESPAVRAARKYRDDSFLAPHTGDHGLVAARIERYKQHHNDVLPAADEVLAQLNLWGAPNQYVTGEFAVRALRPVHGLTVELARLEGPGGHRVERDNIDLRIAHLRERHISLFRSTKARGRIPDLLLRDDAGGGPQKGPQGGFGSGRAFSSIPAHESRHFVLTVYVAADAPSGIYQGTMDFLAEGERLKSMKVQMEVMPIDLRPVEGYYGTYHRAQPVDSEKSNYMPAEMYREQLETQVRYGMNTTSLYGGFEAMKYAAEAGMTEAPFILRTGVGQDEAHEQTAEAEAMGLSGLLWHGIDEPRTDERIELARKVALRRQRWDPPVGIFMAINSRESYEALKDVVTNPVLNIKVFDIASGASEAARERGFYPISYWVTGIDYPLNHRAWTGLYNTACGYHGTSPWAFYDVHGEPGTGHDVIMPDENKSSIPTFRLYAYRDGVDDVRYLQALDRTLERAERKIAADHDEEQSVRTLREAWENAKSVRETHFENIDQRWHWHLVQLKPDDYDKARRAFAESIVLLEHALHSIPD